MTQNVLCGALLPFVDAVLLCTLLTTIGSSMSYALVKYGPSAYIRSRFETQIANMERALQSRL